MSISKEEMLAAIDFIPDKTPYGTPDAPRKVVIEAIRALIEQGKPKVSRKLIEEISYYIEWKDKDELRNDILPNKVLPKLGLEVEGTREQ